MRARDVVGRRIVAVEQQRIPQDGEGHPAHMVTGALVLDNGRRIYFTVHETLDQYDVEARVTQNGRG